MKKWASLVFLLVLSSLKGSPLLVHFEERHSGSFFHFAENLDLDSPVTLILIDAHSDASSVAGSDAIRSQLRRVPHMGERRVLLESWRKEGRVQVFDWVEPLMPYPFARVLWLGGEGEIEKVHQQVDQEAERREAGAFASRWQALAREDFSSVIFEGEPVVVSLDLDYFAGLKKGQAASELRNLWQEILALPNLQGVSVALSGPWLRDEGEARFLSEEMLTLILSTHNVRLRFEPFAPLGPDRSEEARRRLALGENQPTFDFTTVGDSVRDLILREKERISVTHDSSRWESLLERWQRERGGWWIEVDDHQKSIDERVRVKAGSLPTLRLRNREGRVPEEVSWYFQNANRVSYNVMPEVALGKKFADAGQWLGLSSHLLAKTSESALAGSSWAQVLGPNQGWGSVKIWAEATADEEVFRSPLLELRVYEGEGFRGALTEQFGLPYIFGVGRLHSGGLSGPALGWGNDCANLLVWAWHRDGFPLPWCNPGQLRRFLQPMGILSEEVLFTAEDIRRGMILDRGNHMAGLWQDQEPHGVVDGGDLLIHQLGGKAEVISVSDFVRNSREVRVWKRPDESPSAEVSFGGDINLDGVADEEVLKKLMAASGNEGLVANLECVLSRERIRAGGRYRFRVSPKRVRLLKEGGVVGLGLANNPALDCGEEGLRETRSVLRSAGIQVTGAGESLLEALEPIRISGKEEVAVFAVNLINGDEVSLQEGRSGVLCLPRHQQPLREAMRREVSAGRKVVVMVHWGREFTQELTAGQRKWGRWLVEAGASRVVGSHPHVEQKSDFWLGSQVDFSLGDLVFPGR